MSNASELGVGAASRILYFVAEDWYFVSHRLALAQEALQRGYKVAVLCRVSKHKNVIESAGIEVIPLSIDRSDAGLLANALLFFRVLKIVQELGPVVLHNVAQKPILIGTLVGLMCRVPRIVNAFGGLGTLFSSFSIRSRFARACLSLFYRVLFLSKRTHMIVQNNDDKSWIRDGLGVPLTRLSLIRGAGVDIDYYSPNPPMVAPSAPVITLVARMLRDKGVVEFCDAVRILKSRGVAARFWLVGAPDPLNPSSLTEPELLDFTKIGVEYLGRSNDIKGIWQESDISVLPSYREGLPLSLLESAAMGKPIVTTDVPGCREVVDDGVNGFLVPPKDPKALADAIEKLAVDTDLRWQFGRASRERAVKEFSSDRVIADTLTLYEYE